MLPQSFYVAAGDDFLSTELTRGPWSSEHQHAGPPAALLARMLERAVPAELAVTRVTVEILRPIPIAPLRVATQPLRAGRKVQWHGADLLATDGTLLARAHAVAIRTTALQLPVQGDPVADPVLPPAASAAFQFGFFAWPVAYHTGMECRLARGTVGAGPVAMWMRMRYPLVAGETPSPLQRTMIAADSGNGVSFVLDPRRHTFVNPDLTVHLHRPPAGEWVCLDARTIPQPHGIGIADTRLLDEQGPIGRSVQSLVIDARSA